MAEAAVQIGNTLIEEDDKRTMKLIMNQTRTASVDGAIELVSVTIEILSA